LVRLRTLKKDHVVELSGNERSRSNSDLRKKSLLVVMTDNGISLMNKESFSEIDKEYSKSELN